jgi:TctA family transporter
VGSNLYVKLPPVATSPRLMQTTAVALAFIAATLSLVAFAMQWSQTGQIYVTPLFGGLFMLGLGIAGLNKLRQG